MSGTLPLFLGNNGQKNRQGGIVEDYEVGRSCLWTEYSRDVMISTVPPAGRSDGGVWSVVGSHNVAKEDM